MDSTVSREVGRPRILLVEDDPAVRRSLQLLLRFEGYDVRAYATGEGLASDPEALRSSCVISDLVMPAQDGVTMLSELRQAGWSGPAILISGHLEGALEERASVGGFDLVLSKPIRTGELSREVARLLSESATH